MKANVNKEGCVGCALCVDACPQVFEIGEDGLSQCICNEVPDDAVDCAKEARDGCPVSVITLK